jgi:sodium/bile acid cotransporter 7
MLLLRKQWFLLGLVVASVLGYVPGPVQAAATHLGPPRFAVMGLLLLISLSLPLASLRSGMLNGRGILTALAVSYLLIPVLAFIAGHVFVCSPDIRVGFAIVAAVPTTLASCTILTRSAGGNVGLSLAVTVLANILNVAAAPLLLALMARLESPLGSSFAYQVAADLALVIGVPLVLGQALRALVADRIDPYRRPIDTLCKLIILLTVLGGVASSSSAAPHGLSVGTIALVGLVCATVHLTALWIGWRVSRRLDVARGDSVAVAFAGSQKTLPLGVFLASAYFSHLPFAALPILMFHPAQLIVDGLLAEPLRRWAGT